MVDKRLLGTLAIAGVLSSLLVVLIFSERIERTVQVIRNDWQSPLSGRLHRLPQQETRFPYTLGLVIRRPVTRLALEFAFLRNSSMKVNYSNWDGLSMRERALSIEQVRRVDESFRKLPDFVDSQVDELLTGLDLRGRQYDLYILDYRALVVPIAPAWASSSLAVVFAFLFDSEGNLTQFYQGNAELFGNVLTSLEDLTITRNENSTTFVPAILSRPGYLALEESLNFGVLNFENLGKDDRISILMAVNGAKVGGSSAIMQIVRIAADGVEVDPIVNVLPR